MASELAIKMKFRKYTAEQLQNVINNTDASDTEISVAKELIQKFKSEEKKAEEPIKMTTPKREPKVSKKKVGETVYEQDEEEINEYIYKEEEKERAVEEKQAKKLEPIKKGKTIKKEILNVDESERLDVAEKEFDDRQSKRKAKKEVEAKPERETKRHNIDDSVECPGFKVGSKVCIKGAKDVGTIERIYVSSDGKEKCMIKFGSAKAIKKRINTIEHAK